MPNSDVDAIVARTEDFIATSVLPLDDEYDGDIAAAGGDEARIELQAGAREAGVFAPHAPVELGGLGLGMVDRAPVFEAAGRSLFGPVALNINAPDEGNVHLLDHIATAAQRERYLAPLVSGEMRSAFAMTEPAPGAGSDPTALKTAATKVDGGWLINGEKHFITGVDGAGFFIIMARTGEHATMFLAPATADGLEVGRHLKSLDLSMIGGHCQMRFTDLFVPDEDVLGEVDRGFAGAQIRLGPARMTHVMRWLGAAVRAHEVAITHVAGREAFGTRMSELGQIQQMIADNEIDIAATRALLMEACRVLDDGGRASKETSIAKAFAGEALHRIADRAVQMTGGLGTTHELPVAKIAREIRPFRIYDGPTEVHRWSLAKRAVRAVTSR